jgi:hypothetical protein
VYSTTRIRYFECSIYSKLYMMAEFLGSATEWRRNPKPNFVLGYSLNGILTARLLRSRRCRNSGGSFNRRITNCETIS